MTAQFPFKSKYRITQGYSDNFNHYPESHHGALDIVPIDDSGNFYPALIYPVFDGSEISIQDTDPIHGKGVLEEITLDQAWIDYYKSNDCIPANYIGIVYLRILYWHMLHVFDKNGTLTQDIPIGPAGNTGLVYHNGQPVPDSQKGVYPYLGGHTHLETILLPDTGTTFNLDKDPKGRIDPALLFKKGQLMNQAKVIKSKNNPTVYVVYAMPNMDYLTTKASIEGFELPIIIPDTDTL